MPGTERRADGQPREAIRETDRQTNIVSLISHFADDNLTIVRNLSTGLALAGVIIIARSIKLTTKFCSVAEIPVHFIKGNVSLRGRVRSVSDHGLEVEHIPVVLPLVARLFTQRKSERIIDGAPTSYERLRKVPPLLEDFLSPCVRSSSLMVRLAGVEPTAEGQLWLQRQLAPAQLVWFKPISREDDVLHCLVSHSKGAWWSRCVNEELLRLGLARTVPLCAVAPGSRLYWRLHRRLLRAESKAERRGRGLWKGRGFWERVSDGVRYNRLLSAVKRLFGRT